MSARIFTNEELSNPSDELIASLKANLPDDYSEWDNFLNQQDTFISGSL